MISTVFVSLEKPYHLADVPHIRTMINCYAASDAVIDALMEKLMGKRPFCGKSPVDPFCGRWEACLLENFGVWVHKIRDTGA